MDKLGQDINKTQVKTTCWPPLAVTDNGALYLSLKQSLKFYFETKNRFYTEVKPTHKVSLSLGFKPCLHQTYC